MVVASSIRHGSNQPISQGTLRVLRRRPTGNEPRLHQASAEADGGLFKEDSSL